jgi:hypothetical protein
MKSSKFPTGFWYWFEGEGLAHGPFTKEGSAKSDGDAHSPTGHFQVSASKLPLPVEQIAPPIGMDHAEYVEVCKDCAELAKTLSREEVPTAAELRALLPSLMKATKAFSKQLVL